MNDNRAEVVPPIQVGWMRPDGTLIRLDARVTPPPQSWLPIYVTHD